MEQLQRSCAQEQKDQNRSGDPQQPTQLAAPLPSQGLPQFLPSGDLAFLVSHSYFPGVGAAAGAGAGGT